MRQFSFVQKGFTLLELVVVIGIITLISGIVTVNLIKFQRTASISAAITVLTADMKRQQLKAMSGATEGGTTSDNYSIYFQSDRYTLFHGSTYNASDLSNYIVILEKNISFSTINLPDNTIVYSQLSGEVLGFSPTQNYFIIRNTVGDEQKIISFNRHGVVTGIE